MNVQSGSIPCEIDDRALYAIEGDYRYEGELLWNVNPYPQKFCFAFIMNGSSEGWEDLGRGES